MPTLDELIIRELNPFDQYVTGHILEEDLDPTEDAIHRPVLEAILAEIEALRTDRRRQTRTLLLVGDSGSGKSFLLKRLRTALGKSASLAYVPPWPHTGCLRRHILAQIIESLRHKAPRAKDTQLIVWLKDLLKKWIKELKENPTLYKSDQNDMRRDFIKYMRKTAPNGIHNPNEFFGVLYDLSSEELHDHACDWLRGVHIDEEAAATLGNPDPIDDDAKAESLIHNLGRVGQHTRPIVLCFDQLDSIPKLADGSIDIQSLLDFNTALHAYSVPNYLVIVSIITDTWNQVKKRLGQSDLARFRQPELVLEPIDLDQAEALWRLRVSPLHQQADNPPDSPLFPLSREALEKEYPNGETKPRQALNLGQCLYKEHKNWLIDRPRDVIDEEGEFRLIWEKYFDEHRQRLEKHDRCPSSDHLVSYLRRALEVMDYGKHITGVVLDGKYTHQSLALSPGNGQPILGLVWVEEPNAATLRAVLTRSRHALERGQCGALILLRAARVPGSNTATGELFNTLFSPNAAGRGILHVVPELDSVHQLATVNDLMNQAAGGDLMVASAVKSVNETAELIRNGGFLANNSLLARVRVRLRPEDMPVPIPEPTGDPLLKRLGTFFVDTVYRQDMLGRQLLLKLALEKFPKATPAIAQEELIRLCEEGSSIGLLDPKAPPEAQIVIRIAA